MENSLFWKINNNSYILGTIHAYSSDIIRIPEEVYTAISECDILALELESTNISFSEMQQFAISENDGYLLENYLSETAFNYLLSLNSINGQRDYINKYKPLFVTNVLLREYPSFDSIENNLHKYATSQHKQVVGLENVADQIKAIDDIPLEVQAEILEESLLKGNNPLDELEKMMQYYSNQDLSKIKSLTDFNSSSFMESMHEKRNINMANRIEEYISKNSLFVAIGALHITDIDSKQGVISLLKDQGCIVEPIKAIFKA